jgi:tetratricopeptide (TPR) repeat protein/transcriptional regulator with XRE-family HTH domain
LFADLVRGHRHRLGLTQDELADQCGVAVRTIRGIEAGRIVRPRPGTVRLLADVFSLTNGDRERFLHTALDGPPGGDRTTVASDRRPVPAELPADVSGFTGRDVELAALDALIDPDTRTAATAVISAVSGTAGVGKTALAVRWGHRVADRFPDGQLYINLRGYDPDQPVTPADALARLLEALGVADSDIPVELDARAATYRTQVAGRRMLIVLDNASTVGQVRPLLPGATSCIVLVTSRDRMAGLVARDGAHRVDLDLLPLSDAVALLRTLVGERVDAEPEATAALAHRCARLPLALRVAAELAVARPDTSLADLAGELADHQRRLHLLDADGDPRTDVTAVFSWSLRHLTPEAARTFRLLGLHPGPDITTSAAASLAGVAPTVVRAWLTELARANLLAVHAPDRYALHDLLRDYATQLVRGEDAQATRAALARMFDHYTHSAHAASAGLKVKREPMLIPLGDPAVGATVHESADAEAAMEWLTAEQRALLAAIRHAADTGFDTHAWQLAWSMTTFLDRRTRRHIRGTAWQIALEAARRLGHAGAEATAHRALADITSQLGQHEEALHHLRQALDLDTRAGDLIGQAQAHRSLGLFYVRTARYREALDHTQRALELFDAAGHERGVAHALNSVGWCHVELGQYAEAVDHCERALELLRRFDDMNGQAATLDTLGWAHHHLGNHREAADYYDQALILYTELGDTYSQALVLHHLGDTYEAGGDLDAARVAWQQTIDVLADLDHADIEAVRAKLARVTGVAG